MNEKEKSLNFIIEENDELESEILKLNESMLIELETIENEHKKAINMLIQSYEDSLH